MKPIMVVAERSVSDALLLRRIAGGDLNALGLLYDRYAGDLIAFARRMSHTSEADDLVQNVFLRVLRIAGTFNPDALSARPWLFAITVRVARERERSLRRWTATLLRFGREVSERPAALPSVDAACDVTRAMQRLSESKRAALLLAEVEGFSCAEIAEMLRVPVGTVWTRLHHARRELRAYLEGEKP